MAFRNARDVAWLAMIVLASVVMWTVFTKAGRPGWACLIPIYNAMGEWRDRRQAGMVDILGLIPLVNIIVSVIVHIGVAERFGKSTAFGVGLFFLPFIFYPILAWGDARYQA